MVVCCEYSGMWQCFNEQEAQAHEFTLLTLSLRLSLSALVSDRTSSLSMAILVVISSTCCSIRVLILASSSRSCSRWTNAYAKVHKLYVYSMAADAMVPCIIRVISSHANDCVYCAYSFIPWEWNSSNCNFSVSRNDVKCKHI